MGRGIAYKRHQNERVIRKRLNIVKNIWQIPDKDIAEDGHYRKYNLSCACGMCDVQYWGRVPSIPELKRNREDQDAIDAGFESVA